MNADRSRAREIFLAALELPAADVAAFVASACGDDQALRDEVVSLLARHDDAQLIGGPERAVALAPTRLELGRFGDAGTSPSAFAHGRYRTLSELGSGGCGRVDRVFDLRLARVVALKRVREDDDTLRMMLSREARLLAYLDHPGAVQVFDSAADEATAYYTMRILEGETLRQRIERSRAASAPIPVGEAVRIVRRVGETMASAHAKGVMHLDLKPENVVLLPFGPICVIDWGLSRFYDRTAYEAYLRDAGHGEMADVGELDVIGGTPGYMPAEQLTGERLTPAADIYACGAILYELLAGDLPFGRAASLASAAHRAAAPPRAIHEMRADVPARLGALCLRMLRPDPSERPASIIEVLSELTALAEGGVSSDVLELDAGDVLFSEGESGSVAYQILSGTVGVTVETADGPKELARRTVGDLVGELAVVSAAPRSATVTALERTRVAVVTANTIERELDAASPLVARMLRSLSDRLREEAKRR